MAKYKKAKDFKEVLGVIRNNDWLNESIVIKGGVSISIFLGLDERETKDIDTYLIKNSSDNVLKTLDNLQEELEDRGVTSKRIELKNNKIPKILLNEMDIEITFKQLETKIDVIEHNGILIANPLDTLLDKVDRLSRLWKTQVKSNPYENIQNLLRGNYQRDIFDIYYLIKKYSLLPLDVLESKFLYFKGIEDKKDYRGKNYDYDNFYEMTSLFNDAINFIFNKKFKWEGYPFTFEKFLKSNGVFKTNYSDLNYQDLKDTVLDCFQKELPK